MHWYAPVVLSFADNANTPCQKLYVHFDSEEANKYGVVRKRTERLWQESIDSQDDSIATAVAGAILLFLYGSESGKAYALLYHYVRVGLTLALVCDTVFRRRQHIQQLRLMS